MTLLPLLAALSLAAPSDPKVPFRADRFLFPPHPQHNHASSIVEAPNGDLLACWYRGSGERRADDVAVMGARLRKDAAEWSEPFVLADTPGFPDTNPCLFVDPKKRLWLIWQTIQDNHWESALMKAKVSRDYTRREGPPRWERETVLHLKPGPEFGEILKRDLEKQWEPYRQRATPEEREKLTAYLAEKRARAETTLNIRLGWMTRAHPAVANAGRYLIPLYSDGFDFSLMAYSDDTGETWKVSEPLVGPGNVQPAIARRKDGTLVAYFRDNGPPPQRVMASESADNGHAWTLARDTDLPDPGAGVDVVALQSGLWVLVNNDTEKGRHSLALSVSEDEGRTWAVWRHLERDAPGPDAGSYSYPSILQAKDGTIHVTYSYRADKTRAAREGQGETIRHVRCSEAWLREGRPNR